MELRLAIETGVSNPRVRQLLGPATLLLHPIYGLLLLLLACLPLLPFASQPLGVPLAALSTYIMLMAIRLEQPWLNLTPLPPLTVACLGAWLRCGLGGLLLATGHPMAASDGNSAFWAHLPQAQLLWLITSALVVLVFAASPKRQPGKGISTSQGTKRQPLVNLAVTCGIFAIIAIGIGVIAGTLDRSPDNYLHWVSQRWRPDSLFTMFARFRDIFFILAPLAIWKAGRNWQRFALIGMLAAYPALALPLGGRGLLLYPILYATIGLWLTAISAKTLRIIIAAGLAASITIIPSVELYRGTTTFKDVGRTDFVKRVKLLGDSYRRMTTEIKPQTLLNSTGISLYGCSDGYLFQDPAASRPRAGWHRMEALLTAWLPELIAPKATPVRDSHIIAEEIRGRTRQEAESMTFTSFACVSLGGDLYWRGGWLGVALGSGAAALAYRLLSEIWYRYASWQSGWQILLLLYPATFLTMYPAGSIGETAWLWMWDLPKYVVLISLLCLIAGRFPQASTPRP